MIRKRARLANESCLVETQVYTYLYNLAGRASFRFLTSSKKIRMSNIDGWVIHDEMYFERWRHGLCFYKQKPVIFKMRLRLHLKDVVIGSILSFQTLISIDSPSKTIMCLCGTVSISS